MGLQLSRHQSGCPARDLFRAVWGAQMLPEEAVLALFVATLSTAQIATHLGVGQRRVQQVVQPLQPGALPVPYHDTLEMMIIKERKNLGMYYGRSMMAGALRAAHPEFAFSERRVSEALARLFPEEHVQRKYVLARMSCVAQP